LGPPRYRTLAGEPPVPPRDFSDRRQVSDSDWQLLQDITILPAEEQAALRDELRVRADKYRRYGDRRAVARGQALTRHCGGFMRRGTSCDVMRSSS
jgi:hypothetical protein